MLFIYHVNHAEGTEWVTCANCGSEETHADVDIDYWVCESCGHVDDTQDCPHSGDCDYCERE